MAELVISSMYPAVRVLLGDGGSDAEGWDYEEEQIANAISMIVNSGFLPCVAIKAGDATKLDPAPPNRATWGWLVAKAAHILIGGANPVSYKTRALSVFQDAAVRRDSLTFIEAMLSELDGSGNVCGTAEDVEYQGLFQVAADLATYCKIGICTPPTFPCCP